jgi:hypothetical protein
MRSGPARIDQVIWYMARASAGDGTVPAGGSQGDPVSNAGYEEVGRRAR